MCQNLNFREYFLNFAFISRAVAAFQRISPMIDTYCYISDTYEFVWYLIPKNASSSLRQVLTQSPYDSEFCSRRKAEKASYSQYLRFAFFRDPIERILSAYQEVSFRVDTLDGYNHDLRFAKFPDTMERFELFLDEVEEDPWDDHVTPQCELVRGIEFDFLGRVEWLQADWDRFFREFYNEPSKTLPRIRSREARRENGNYGSYYIERSDLSASLLDRIERIFLEDFEQYHAI